MLSQLKLLGLTLVWQMCLSDIQGCSFPWVLCKLRGEKRTPITISILVPTYMCMFQGLALPGAQDQALRGCEPEQGHSPWSK